jgi:hypothetical protein
MAGRLLELLMHSLDSWEILSQQLMEARQAEAAHERLVSEARQFSAVQRPGLWAALRSRMRSWSSSRTSGVGTNEALFE